MLKQFFFILILLFNFTKSYAYDQRFIVKAYQDKINLQIDLTGGYKIYWLYAGDTGQATSIDFSGSQNLKTYQIIWPFPVKEKFFKKLEHYFYTGNLSIPIYLKADNEKLPILLKANLSYIICKEQCMPVSQEIEQSVNIVNNFFQPSSFTVKDVTYHEGYINFIAQFKNIVDMPEFIVNSADIKFVQQFLLKRLNNYEFNVQIVIDRQKYNKIKGRKFDIYSNKAEMPAVLKIPEPEIDLEGYSLFLMLVFAVIGGFILNFMPCVLPVLSLKLLSVSKQDKNKITSFILVVAGILVTFLGLAIVSIFLKNSGRQFGLGINFQHSEFIIFLAILTTVFISNTLGRINFSLPTKVNDFLVNYRVKSSYLEDFFSGSLATILSTPCTAPFLGSAMALALASSNMVILLAFLATGLGFSLPYLLLIACPKLVNCLPKPGPWLGWFKKSLAIMLILTLIWLLGVLYAQIGQRPVIGLFCLLLLLKFTIENIHRLFIKTILISLIITCCVYLPEVAYKENLHRSIAIDNLWKKFEPDKITKYVKQGKVVVVDITADWCITCKFNKLMVWDRDHALQLLNQKNIVALRGDYTNYDEDIYNYLIMNKASGIPFNKIYGPNAPAGILLPVIVVYNDVVEAINKAFAH